MTEIWLRTNRRALCFSAVPPAFFALFGFYLVFGLDPAARAWWHWIGACMALIGLFNVAILLLQLREPRIAYQTGFVLFYLVPGPPIAVPVNLVEAFFLGQGPIMLTGIDNQRDSTVNLVARISQRDPSWGNRDVKPALGRWADGYVTIRGTWCEPLNGEVIRRLNRRLREVTEVVDSQGESMDDLIRFKDRVGLLVSVRDAAEAEVALDGGADVIDIKEPDRGSLGAADAEVVAAVVATVAGRASVSIAAGELIDWPPRDSRGFTSEFASGAAFVKFGLFGCAAMSAWPERWRQAVESLRGNPKPVAVAYADWLSAAAPAPDQVLAEAKLLRCRALLVDTWDKSNGELFDVWPASQLAEFGGRVRDAGIHLVLAGSLRIASLPLAVGSNPTLIAVRGAVCEGDRRGRISLSRVRALRSALDSASNVPRGGPAPAFAV